MYKTCKFVGYCSNGSRVFNRNDNHNDVHPVDETLLREALLKVAPCDDFIKEVVVFDRVIGKTTCVSVDKTDTIVMAYRKGRMGPTPMVLNRESSDCSTLVLILKKIGNSDYIIITTYIGGLSEREPWDPSISSPEEQQRAEAFWSTHALIYDESIITRMAWGVFTHSFSFFTLYWKMSNSVIYFFNEKRL